MQPIRYRELYCPAHFGNSYEVMWPREMRRVLSEAKEWGFTVYGDWFDNADLKDPKRAARHETSFSRVYRERKIAHYRTAFDLGFKLDLLLTPNHVYLDQLHSDLLADASNEKYFGQLLCPSKPEAWEIIIANHRELFDSLASEGVRLDSLSACPFDYGGCACDRCAPWIVTFGKLYRDIHETAREFFPEIRARLVGWWWTKEDHERFHRWAEAEALGTFVSLASFIRYGKTAPDTRLTYPEGCEPHAFVHIGYGEGIDPIDEYGPWGPVVAPRRIEETVRELSHDGYTGLMAYSEGVFDDVNKALLGGLASGMFGGWEAALEAYADRYLGARGADQAAWVEWIAGWGEPFAVDVKGARATFDRLSPGARQSWRLEQLEAKLRIFEAHDEVKNASKWDERRLGSAERFFAERERLQRGIWGLGLVRHVLNADHWRPHQPSWFEEWRSHLGSVPPRERRGTAGEA